MLEKSIGLLFLLKKPKYYRKSDLKDLYLRITTGGISKGRIAEKEIANEPVVYTRSGKKNELYIWRCSSGNKVRLQVRDQK